MSSILTEAEKAVVRTLSEIRINSCTEWYQGIAKLTVVNKFDSFGKAGFKVGDEMLLCNGKPLENDPRFQYVLAKAGVGATMVIRVRRAGQEMDIPLQLLKARKLKFDIEEAQVDLERKIAPA